ncbi:MAG: rhomboid family intramembrane serine protease [Chloroflexi bacterium]|nr:MAG: rhomboid family intramembrane serine protease [Chloroflexota bacterium]
MNDFDHPADAPPPPPTVRLPLPLSKPFFTYILLVIIVVVWLLMELAGGSTDPVVLVTFGANFGPAILDGEVWRLFTSMFLHIGLTHLFFNAYALFIFGLEMERLYGPDRFILTYILAGLFGSLASFAARGPAVFSAGASGAIFGVIGMNLAYFMLHRSTFGTFGRQRMMNTLVIIGINLVFGFTVPGIDNLAHIGGLVAGFAMGYALAPRYQVVDEYTLFPRVVDTVSLLNRWWVPVLALAVLSGGVSLSLTIWG